MEKAFAFFMMLLTLIASLMCSVIPGVPIGYETYADLSYSTGENNTLDVYIPRGAYNRDSSGLILFIHGGSWSGGDKSEEMPRCMAYAAQGYVTATMNYTLYTAENEGELTAFDMLDEIDTALLYIKDFLGERGITVSAAATSGYSAGAHLSMLYAYTRADAAPIPIAFTANQVGPADFDTDIWGDAGIRLAKKLSGTDITEEMMENGEAERVIASVSPASNISENTVPSIFAYGGRDTLVLDDNGESLARSFDAVGAEYEYIHFSNSDHALLGDPIEFMDYYVTLDEYARIYFGY